MAEIGPLRTMVNTFRQLSGRCVSTISQLTTPDIAVHQPTSVRCFDEMPGPTGPHRWPVVGTILNFHPFTDYTAENTYQLLRSMYQRYGPIFRLQLGRNTVVLTEPEDMETVYRNEGRCPSRPNLDLREVYCKRNGVTPRDVSMLQGAEWHALRTPLNKLLVKVDAATHYLPQQNQVADDLLKSLTNPKLDAEKLNELFFRFAAESIGVVCFNDRLGLLDSSENENPEVRTLLRAAKDTFTMLHRSLTGRSLAHVVYRNETYQEYERSLRILNLYSRKQIQRARQELVRKARDGRLDGPNMLSSLLADTTMDDEAVSQILESLFIGGTDSTAGSLTALFYNLAKNPDKQEKLAAEIHKYLGASDEVTPEVIHHMHYLKACVKESFRLHYPVSAVIRVLPNDVIVSGYHVPAGVQFFLVNALTCEHKFENPQDFIPERWLRTAEGRLCQQMPRNAVLPFGIGPRNCLGRRFAEQEIYLAAIKILQKLKIGLAEESRDLKFVYRIFLQPANPVPFTFTERIHSTAFAM